MAPTAVERAVLEREDLKSSIDWLGIKTATHLIKPFTIVAADYYISEATRFRSELEDVHLRILSHCTPADAAGHSTEKIDLLDQLTVHILDLQAIKAALLPPTSGHTPGPSSKVTHTTKMKLPPLQLPSFNGNLADWLTFHDLFVSAVHDNTEISKAQKLTYLRLSLTGEAAKIVKSIPSTDANYDVAWKLMLERFQNNRELAFSILRRFSGQPTVVPDSASSIRSLVDVSKECFRSLEALKVPVDTWNATLVFTIMSKMDSSSRKAWELSLNDTEIPDLETCLDFLEQRARAVAAGASCKSNQGRNPEQTFKHHHVEPTHKKVTYSSHHTGTKSTPCCFCSSNHLNFQCTQVHQMSISERYEALKRAHLCFNCLRSGHSSLQCASAKGCRICHGRHHSLLHKTEPSQSRPSPNTTPSVINHHGNEKLGVASTILATAVINVMDRHGRRQLCRALLDPGSTTSFISETCVQRLGLSRKHVDVKITGLSATPVAKGKGMVSLSITPHFASDAKYSVQALVLTCVTGKLPCTPCTKSNLSHLNGLQLADPNFHKPADVDLLLGSDLFWNILEPGIIKLTSKLPVALASTLGWLVGGNIHRNSSPIVVHVADVNLDKQLQQFWEIESIPTLAILTKEEKECEAHFSTTHARDSTGRFVVQMPIKPTMDTSSLGSSRDIAVRRFQQLERRLNQQPENRQAYVKFMSEYESLGHMELINETDPKPPKVCYIPHHFVIKDSTTTKFRVVFDASSKTSSGVSLNDILMVGQALQDSVFSILLRFRTHPIAFTADIVKFYRQIKMSLEDTNLQRIVWRDDPSKPLRDYRLLTATYGTASAPHHATRTLLQLSNESKNTHPLGSAITKRDFYVDDVMSGATTSEEALQIQSELLEIMKMGALELRKWSSNCPALLEAIPADLREVQLPLSFDNNDFVKTLGLRWSPGPDHFSFRVTMPPDIHILTKREIASEVAKLFDPLGLLAPVIIKAKIFLQDLWKLNLDWDDPLPEKLVLEWNTYKDELPLMEQLKINRCIKPFGTTHVSLLGFCDASEKAYSAVVYLRADFQSSQPVITLVTSKTKVAPIKVLSLPRLELCGALLLSQLIEAVTASLQIPIDLVRAWTDSTVVLCWINSHPSRWKKWVENRVTQIQEIIQPNLWSHVSGVENPADCASRGINPAELANHHLWWTGPPWALEELSSLKPATDISTLEIPDIDKLEEKRIVISAHTNIDQEPSLLFKFSSLRKFKAVTSWCNRFLHNSLPKNRQHRLNGPLSTMELENALLIWIRLVQKTEFSSEIHSLDNGKQLPLKSRLKSLSPFLDSSHTLRVGGRLRNAAVPEDQKHPILLPRHHRLTELIIVNEHLKHFHAGPQLTLSSIQNRFWILNARDAVRHQIRKCVTCVRHGSQLNQQFMGDLPAVRVTPSRPFLKCGVDYCGPFILKPMTTRSKVTFKAYVAVFVCFVTRAIHLELVSSLTTWAFLAAFKRFIARRGKSTDVFSDCGTNFVGAARELKELLALVQSATHNNKVNDFLADEGIHWHFNPPGAPHFGGLWEVGVKSVKYHLTRVVGLARLNFEEMTTVLAQIESCLNSRPLTPASTDPSDLTALTPGHFLIGAPLTAIPEPDLTTEKLNHLSRWQITQQLLQHFWRRWSQEFLSRLQQRPKWLKHRTNLKLNDLVLVRDERLPSLKWKLGRVTDLHPGQDGCVRVVTLKTADGPLKRPIAKLCLLPIDPSTSTTDDLDN